MGTRSITTAGLLVIAAAVMGACSSGQHTSAGNAPAAPSTPAASSAPAAPAPAPVTSAPSSAPETKPPSAPARKPAPPASKPARQGADGAPADNAGGSSNGVARYQPSTVVSQSQAYVLLRTAEPVTRVNAFYTRQFGRGWTVTHKTLTARSGAFTVRKAGHGATVVISSTGTGATIAISTY